MRYLLKRNKTREFTGSVDEVTSQRPGQYAFIEVE